MLAEQFVIISNIDSEIFKGPSNYSTIGYKLFQNCLRQKVEQQLHGSQDAGRPGAKWEWTKFSYPPTHYEAMQMNIVMCFSSKLEEIFIHKRKGRRELSIIKQMQICREDNTSKVIMCASFTNIPYTLTWWGP